MRDDRVALEKTSFPTEQDAVAFLLALYQDQYPLLERESGHERVYRLVACSVPGVSADDGLAERARTCFGLRPADLHRYRVFETWDGGHRTFLRACSHAWALWAWSRWLSAGGKDRFPPGQAPPGAVPAPQEGGGPPFVVHIDAHDDLGTPPLECGDQPGRFRTPVGRLPVDVARPSSIAAAVTKGSIGIGSFIAPFLHAEGEFELVHVFPQHGPEPKRREAWIELVEEPWPVPLRRRGRPGVAIRSPARGAGGERPGGRGGSYTLTDDLSILGELEPSGPVLLDIDMDYFCNRLDNRELPSNGPGDASGSAHSLEDVCRLIDRLGDLLLGNDDLCGRIAVVTLAVSPGFFPSEYWKESLSRLEPTLHAALERPARMPAG